MRAPIIPLIASLAFALPACRGGDPESDTDAGNDTPDAVDPDQRGPYGVGATTLVFVDTRGKPLTVEVWFPADTSGDPWPDPYPDVPISLTAHRDVPSDRRGAPYPVIGFSHGLGGIRMQSASLCEHLASHGFVVIAPDHTGHTLTDYLLGFDSSKTGPIILERPGDVTEAIDHVLALSDRDDPVLAGLADASRLGILGHSFGGITTLMLAGADDDLPGLEDWCKDNRGNACSYVDDVDFAAADATDFGDDRVVAAVAMAPGAWYAFGADGSGMSDLPPTLILGGTKDGVLPWEREIEPTYQALGGTRALAELADAGHYAPFSDMCSLLATFEDCLGPEEGFMAPAQGHAIVEPLVSAFFRRHMLGEEEMDAFLSPPFTDTLDGLTWTSEP